MAITIIPSNRENTRGIFRRITISDKKVNKMYRHLLGKREKTL